ncbi:MAG: hypothetical protein KJ957_06765 [Candidatus Omnitrophica bacterium]|nr:hypothetical protein [Candidatus Omnitrophota bacterium]
MKIILTIISILFLCNATLYSCPVSEDNLRLHIGIGAQDATGTADDTLYRMRQVIALQMPEEMHVANRNIRLQRIRDLEQGARQYQLVDIEKGTQVGFVDVTPHLLGIAIDIVTDRSLHGTGIRLDILRTLREIIGPDIAFVVEPGGYGEHNMKGIVEAGLGPVTITTNSDDEKLPNENRDYTLSDKEMIAELESQGVVDIESKGDGCFTGRIPVGRLVIDNYTIKLDTADPDDTTKRYVELRGSTAPRIKVHYSILVGEFFFLVKAGYQRTAAASIRGDDYIDAEIFYEAQAASALAGEERIHFMAVDGFGGTSLPEESIDFIKEALVIAEKEGYRLFGELTPSMVEDLKTAIMYAARNAIQHNNGLDFSLPVGARVFYDDDRKDLVIQIIGGGGTELLVGKDDVFLVKNGRPSRDISISTYGHAGYDMRGIFIRLNNLRREGVIAANQDVAVSWYHLPDRLSEYKEHPHNPVVTEIRIPLQSTTEASAQAGGGGRSDEGEFERLLVDTLEALDRAEGLLEALPNFEVLDTEVHDLIGDINGMVWPLEALGESEVVQLYRQRYSRLRRELNRQIAIARINERRTTFEKSKVIPVIFNGHRFDKVQKDDFEILVGDFCKEHRLANRPINEIPVVIVSIPAREKERIEELRDLFRNTAVVINTHDIVYTDTARYFENFFNTYPDGTIFSKGHLDLEAVREHLDKA